MVLDLLLKDVIEGTLDAHKVKLLDMNADADRLLKNLLTKSSLMAPILTFVQRKPDAATPNNNTLFPNVSKLEPLAAIEVYADIREEPPRRIELGKRGTPA